MPKWGDKFPPDPLPQMSAIRCPSRDGQAELHLNRTPPPIRTPPPTSEDMGTGRRCKAPPPGCKVSTPADTLCPRPEPRWAGQARQEEPSSSQGQGDHRASGSPSPGTVPDDPAPGPSGTLPADVQAEAENPDFPATPVPALPKTLLPKVDLNPRPVPEPPEGGFRHDYKPPSDAVRLCDVHDGDVVRVGLPITRGIHVSSECLGRQDKTLTVGTPEWDRWLEGRDRQSQRPDTRPKFINCRVDQVPGYKLVVSNVWHPSGFSDDSRQSYPEQLLAYYAPRMAAQGVPKPLKSEARGPTDMGSHTFILTFSSPDECEAAFDVLRHWWFACPAEFNPASWCWAIVRFFQPAKPVRLSDTNGLSASSCGRPALLSKALHPRPVVRKQRPRPAQDFILRTETHPFEEYGGWASRNPAARSPTLWGFVPSSTDTVHLTPADCYFGEQPMPPPPHPNTACNDPIYN